MVSSFEALYKQLLLHNTWQSLNSQSYIGAMRNAMQRAPELIFYLLVFFHVRLNLHKQTLLSNLNLTEK